MNGVERERKDEVTEVPEKTSGEMDIFVILVVVIISQV